MSLRGIQLAVALAILSAVSAASEAPPKYSQKALMKNWALSRCLAEAYSDQSSKDDANATAGAYLESGKQPIEAYEKLGEMAVRYAKLNYGGASGSKLNTMKCIDLFNSKELDALADKLSRAR
jgi:hypothetical protein